MRVRCMQLDAASITKTFFLLIHSSAQSISLLPPQEVACDCDTSDDDKNKDRMLIPRHIRIPERVAIISHLCAHRVNDSYKLNDAEKAGDQQQKYGNKDSHRPRRSHLMAAATHERI